MSLISVSHLRFGYEGSYTMIFEDLSLSLDTNWRLGLIGRNGRGKTTLLKLLMGQESYEGEISASVAFDYFPFSPPDLSADTLSVVDMVCREYDYWRLVRELALLQVDEQVLYRPFGTLSFGERTKVLLAALFLNENHFLLIDEPTNHLDAVGRRLLGKYLAGKKGFILVSHDRDLLDSCIDHVLVLNRKTIEVQNGNFSSWWENKQRKDQFAIAEDEKHRKEIKKLKQAARRTSEWADKSERTKIGFDPIKEHDRSVGTRSFIGAKTKKMQSRVKQIEKRIGREIEEKADLLQDLESTKDLKLTQLIHHKNTLVNITDYTLQYTGAIVPVFTDLTLSIKRGERIALHGENGCGKSTIIKSILQKSGFGDVGTAFLEEGICEVASGLVISYVNQDTADLRGGISEFCEEHHLDKSMFCTILRHLDFERNQFSENMENYSEGQKKKVLLAASLLTPAHLYIWDEPLNYIDVFSRMQIEKLLLEYQPTMLFVEHDQAFSEKIATRIVDL